MTEKPSGIYGTGGAFVKFIFVPTRLEDARLRCKPGHEAGGIVGSLRILERHGPCW
jgi:hypothetical protein